MSKIFEALENARVPLIENIGGAARVRDPRFEVAAAATAPVARRTSAAFRFSAVNMEDEMVRLHYSLTGLLTAPGCRVVEFIASRPGEGTSTVAREYARVAATRFNQHVLLLELQRDAAPRGNRADERDQAPFGLAPSKVRDTSLYVASMAADIAVARRPTTSSDAAGSSPWLRFRDAYDLVLVDAPPATTGAVGLAVARDADGVVLVVEADRTRWPVAQRVKESIDRSGGKVLGAVFNKRRYYVPAFVYNRL